MKLYSENHYKLITTFGYLGDVHQALGEKDTAIFFKKLAFDRMQSALAENENLLDDAGRYIFYNSLVDSLIELLAQQGRIAEAQQIISIIKEEEYSDFINMDDRSGSLTTAVPFTARERKFLEIFREISAGLFESASERNRLAQEKETTPPSEWDSSVEAERLAEIEKLIEEHTKAFQDFLVNLREEFKTITYAEHREEIAQMSLELLGDIKAILKDMGNGAVLIHTVITDECLFIILTTATPDEAPLFREYEIPKAELNEKILAFRKSLTNRVLDVLTPARELYDVIIGPIEKDLEKAGAQTLMFSLDGALRYIPITALFDGQEWVAEKYAVAIFTEAAKDMLKDKQIVDEWNIAAMGVTEARRGFSPLPGVKDELEAIVRNEEAGKITGIRGTIVSNDQFTERAFEESLDRGVPVIHIASDFHFGPGTDKD